MVNRVLIILFLILPFWVGIFLPVNSSGQPIPGRFIVVLKDDVPSPDNASLDMAVRNTFIRGHVYRNALKGFSASLTRENLSALIKDPRVKFIEPDLVVHAAAQTIPTGVNRQKAYTQRQRNAAAQTIPTGVNRIDADLSPTARINGVDERVNIDIAVIDTGVSRYHPDLNFYRGITISGAGKSGGNDDNGHGSHVAGTAAAKDNGTGVAGVAPGARLWSVKVLNRSGSGTISGVIAGIDYVTQHSNEIDVANMSLGTTGKSSALRAAIQKSAAKGVVYVVSAGNSAKDVYGDDGIFDTSDDFIPAAYPEVITVSAIADSDGQSGALGTPTSWGPDDTFAGFSNYGARIDLAAPGVAILSTWKGTGYNTISGTSMAAPHVTGTAALYIATNGKPTSLSGVEAVRQGLIIRGMPQTGLDGFSGDPDAYPEPLVNAESL